MRARRLLIVNIAALSFAALAAPSIAVAAEPNPNDSGTSIAAAEAVSPDIGEALLLVPDADSGAFTSAAPLAEDDVAVTIPADPLKHIAIENDDLSAVGLELGIGLPTASSSEAGEVTPEGAVVYASPETNAVDIVVDQTHEALRVRTVIPTSDSPAEYAYPISGGATPRLTSDGGAELAIVDGATEIILGVVAPPWAFDANGESVNTWYEVRGSTLVQVVDHGSRNDIAYPVVADPTLTQINLFQFRIRWNRAESTTIANGGWGVAAITGICIAAGAKLGPIGAAAAGAVCAAHIGALVYNAGVGLNSSPRRCVQLTWTMTPGIWNPGFTWVDTYGC